MTWMQSAVRLIYPDQCAACGALVEGAHGFCGACWRDTPFLTGLTCDCCAEPLLGEADEGEALCDTCLEGGRPWGRGRAALFYEGSARRVVLGLKHGDRTDLAKPAARWMVQAGQDVLGEGVVIIPVPIHWRRLVRRKYNQSAELAREISAQTGLGAMPDALRRTKSTPIQDGKSVAERFANLEGALVAQFDLRGAQVVLVDDVMTSGATLTAAAQACLEAGAKQISVLVLARVAKT